MAALGQTITERASGTPFFAEEIARELAERGVLRGEPGAYVSTQDTAEITVPATLQAAVAARIDRLKANAKRTLSAAALVGTRFTTELITALGIRPVVDELVAAQLIDRVRFIRRIIAHEQLDARRIGSSRSIRIERESLLQLGRFKTSTTS